MAVGRNSFVTGIRWGGGRGCGHGDLWHYWGSEEGGVLDEAQWVERRHWKQHLEHCAREVRLATGCNGNGAENRQRFKELDIVSAQQMNMDGIHLCVVCLVVFDPTHARSCEGRMLREILHPSCPP